MDPKKIFAARQADPKTVRACIDAGADMAAREQAGLHRTAVRGDGHRTRPLVTNLAVLRMLLEAGSPLEYPAPMAAPRSTSRPNSRNGGCRCNCCWMPAPRPTFSDSHGNHITVNAMMEEVVGTAGARHRRRFPNRRRPSPNP
jgi:hypothetical protein